MTKKEKIIYVGSLNKSSNSYRRLLALKRLGHNIVEINIDEFIYESFFSKIHHHFNLGPGIIRLSNHVKEVTLNFRPDMIWVDNRPFLTLSCINKIKRINPSISVVNLLTDDPFGEYSSGWQLLKKTACLYDYIFVQRYLNIQELKDRGAKNVLLCDRSFDPIWHRPINLSNIEKTQIGAQIGFVGTYAPNRSYLIRKLIEEDIKVYIWGNDWHRSPDWNVLKPYFRGIAIYGEEYTKVINAIDINLHFLRKENRDDQDSRSFEIPACGKFMIAERTEKHQKYFREGIEAEYFSSYKELKDKLLFYISNPMLAERIGQNARMKCIKNGYDHDTRLLEVIQQIQLHKK